MADWGLYAALRGRDDWSQKRQDQMVNFQMIEGLRAKRATENQQRMKMEAELGAYQEAMQNLNVLKQDQERIRGVEKTARQDIISGIAKYDGDVKKFMSSGGIMAMQEYKNSITQSDEYTNAIENKQNMALWLQDRAKGMWDRPVSVDSPYVDKKTGKQMSKPKTMTMTEQLRLFEDGKLNNFKYGGSEKKITVNPSLFKNSIKNAKDPYSPDNYVTQSDMFDAVLMLGGSKEQAMERARDYGNALKSTGNPESAWRWGAGDPTKLMQLNQQQGQHEDMMKYRYWSADQQNKLRSAISRQSSGGQVLGGVTDHTNRVLISGGDGTVSADKPVANQLAKVLGWPTLSQNTKENPFSNEYSYSGNIMTQNPTTGEMYQYNADDLGISVGDPNNSTTAFVTIGKEIFMPVFAKGNNPVISEMAIKNSANAHFVTPYTNPISGESGQQVVGFVPVSQFLKNTVIQQSIDKNLGLTSKHERFDELGTSSSRETQQAYINQVVQATGVDPNDPVAVQNAIQEFTNVQGTYYGQSNPGMQFSNEVESMANSR